MLVRFLLMKSRKGLADDVLQTSATHTDLVHGVTAQAARQKQKTAFKAVFSRLSKVEFSQPDRKSTKINCCEYNSFSIPIVRTCGSSSLQP